MLLIGGRQRRPSHRTTSFETAEKPAAGPGPRLLALALLGTVIGAGGVMLCAPFVRAGDDAGIRAFHLDEAARRARQPLAPQAGAPAPTRHWSAPLFGSRSERPPLARPAVADAPRAATAHGPRRDERHPRNVAAFAPSTGRTICVRMCDGFHAPIGNLRSAADLPAHAALCAAQNPGIPVKLFRVPAGSGSIDGAVSMDGRTYGSMPVAYAYEKSADPGCRPAIPTAGQWRVSLLRDFTLRPGDTIVLDGKAQTFNGAAQWPYRNADFGDFRGSNVLTTGQRRQIDDRIGLTRTEERALALRREMQVSEAAPKTTLRLSELRGAVDPEPAWASLRGVARP